jgi:hypothetical protein
MYLPDIIPPASDFPIGGGKNEEVDIVAQTQGRTVLKIPAPLACFWLGQSEFRVGKEEEAEV